MITTKSIITENILGIYFTVHRVFILYITGRGWNNLDPKWRIWMNRLSKDQRSIYLERMCIINGLNQLFTNGLLCKLVYACTLSLVKINLYKWTLYHADRFQHSTKCSEIVPYWPPKPKSNWMEVTETKVVEKDWSVQDGWNRHKLQICLKSTAVTKMSTKVDLHLVDLH